jgi:hypothetical protein
VPPPLLFWDGQDLHGLRNGVAGDLDSVHADKLEVRVAAQLDEDRQRRAGVLVALPGMLEESQNEDGCQGQQVTAGRARRGRPMLSSRRILKWTVVGATFLAVQGHTPAAYAANPNGTDTAETLADQAYKEQAAGKFAEAIGTYSRAYELSGAGAILFNIATIYDRKLHERALAMEYFRRYLQTPDAESAFVQKATERLSVLKAEADEEERSRRVLPSATPGPGASPLSPPSPTAQPLPATPPPDVPPPGASKAWHTAGIVVGVTGIAGVGASMILGVLTKDKSADANEFCGTTTCRDPRGVTLEHQASTLGTAATAAFVAGAAFVAAGVTIYLVAPKSSGGAAPSMTIGSQVRPSYAGVKLAVDF